MVSIWKHTLEGDVPAILRELIETRDPSEFDTVAMKYLMQDEWVQADLEDAQAALAAQIEEMKAQGGEMAQIGRDLERSMAKIAIDENAADEDDEDDFEDLGPPNPALAATGVNLAQSHMFFDDPYCGIPYDEIEAQTNGRITTYADAITNITNRPAKNANFLNTADGKYDELWDTDVGYFFGDWARYWETPEWTLFLTSAQEDKELPIEIDFGRMPTQGFKELLSQLNAMKAEV